jgi:hypothetical protein
LGGGGRGSAIKNAVSSNPREFKKLEKTSKKYGRGWLI